MGLGRTQRRWRQCGTGTRTGTEKRLCGTRIGGGGGSMGRGLRGDVGSTGLGQVEVGTVWDKDSEEGEAVWD